jgi:hypothetical protein
MGSRKQDMLTKFRVSRVEVNRWTPVVSETEMRFFLSLWALLRQEGRAQSLQLHLIVAKNCSFHYTSWWYYVCISHCSTSFTLILYFNRDCSGSFLLYCQSFQADLISWVLTITSNICVPQGDAVLRLYCTTTSWRLLLEGRHLEPLVCTRRRFKRRCLLTLCLKLVGTAYIEVKSYSDNAVPNRHCCDNSKHISMDIPVSDKHSVAW